MRYHVYFLKDILEHADPVMVVDNALRASASAVGLEFSYQDSLENERGTITHKWCELLDGKMEVSLVLDHILPGRYLQIAAPTDEDCDDLGRELRERLSLASVEDLVKVARAADADPGALQRLGMGVNRAHNREAQELLARGLSSPDIEVRYHAAMGASFARWRELAQPLVDARRRERDEGIQRVLDFAVQMCCE